MAGILGPRSSGTILVVDDEPPIRKLLSKVLTRAGYEVLEAGTAQDAARLIQASAIDLVITDLAMPEQDGIDTIRKFRQLRPDLGIIAMSGSFDWSHPDILAPMLTAAEHAGAYASLAKPVQPDELLDTVARFQGRPSGSSASFDVEMMRHSLTPGTTN